MACRATVVLPLDSGPKISVMRPLGMPPMPRALSMDRMPRGMAGMSRSLGRSPSFMMEPLPNCFSIWERAVSMALVFWSLLFIRSLLEASGVVALDFFE